MILGIVAQEARVPPKGTVPFRTFIDDDIIHGVVVSTGNDQLLFAGSILDPDQVYSGNLPQVVTPGFGLGFVGVEAIFRPSVLRDQLLIPFTVHVDADLIERPDIRIPGFLLPSVVAHDDVIFSTPLILDRGMLRAELFFDSEAIFNPSIVGAETLSPTTLASDDVLTPPLVRVAIGPPFVLSDDFIPTLNSTSYYALELVFDDARPVTEVATMNGLNSGVTVSNSGLTTTRNSYSSQFQTAFGAASALMMNKGKFYFEATITSTRGRQDAIGIMLSTSGSFTNTMNNIYCTAVFLWDRGVIWSNNTPYQYHLGACGAGDVIGCAIDLDNHRGWFRKNGGPWNGTLDDDLLPTIPPNPETGAGAVIIALGDWAPMACFAARDIPFGLPGDEYVFNFGSSEYQSPKPAGFDHWRRPSPFPVSQTADRFGEAFLSIPTTLDAPWTGVIMSNGNLTATKNAGGIQPNVATWSTATQNYGKFYFEVTVNSAHGVGDCVGISPDLNDPNLAVGPSVVCNTTLGQITANYGQPAGAAIGDNFETGDVIRVAVDLTEQTTTYGGQIWFALNDGPWNGDVAADPFLRTGGVKNSGFNYRDNWSPVIGFGGTGTVNGDQMTANFGATPFAYPKPDAYAPWPNKILDVIQALKPEAVVDAEPIFPVFVDTSIKTLSVLEVVEAVDNIFSATSFGGTLSAQADTVVDVDTVYAPGFYGSLDGGLESANVTVSNAGRTATLTTSLNNTGARSINFQIIGKFYFEITADNVHSSNGAGLLLATGTYFNMINNGSNCLSVYANTGNIYSNGGSTGKTLGAVTNGTVLGFAIDLTSRKGWVRKPTGSWNGDAAADPVTGVGGVTIGPGYFAPAVGFGGGGQVAGDAWTANFGRSAFAIVPPTGFGAGWPGGSAMALIQTGAIASDDAIPSPTIMNIKQIVTPVAAVASDDNVITPAKATQPPAATLDGVATNVTLSGGNLIATHNAAVTNSGARSATQRSTGKFYFEIVVGQTTGTTDAAGILSGTYTDLMGPFNCFAVRLATGAIYGGNVSTGFSVGACVPGDVLGFAVDLGAGKGWVSKNGGLWNGNATANPVTNVNGGTFTASQSYTPAVGFGGTGTAINDAMTAKFGPAFTSANANPLGFGDWVVPSPTTLASFDGANVNVALSNANLTVRLTVGISNSGARSSTLKSAGKFYFEVTMTQTHGAFDAVGILSASGTMGDFVTNGTNCVAIYRAAGNIFSNNANSGRTLGAIASGDVIGIAIDLNTRKGWMRKNGGNWNGLAIGSENPATGLGGVTIAPTVSFAPAVGFGGTGIAANDESTANFGALAYQTAAPSGFLNWTLG
jgi:SPRY domain